MGHEGSRAGRAVEHHCSPRPAASGTDDGREPTSSRGGMPTTSVEFRGFRALTARPAYAAAGILACYAGLFWSALEAVSR